MRGDDWMSAAQAAAWLADHYRGWSVRTVTGRYGTRLMAVRDGSPPGLCAVIGSFTEVRAELDAAS